MDLTPYTGLDYSGPDRFIHLSCKYVNDVEAPNCVRDSVNERVYHRESVLICPETVGLRTQNKG